MITTQPSWLAPSTTPMPDFTRPLALLVHCHQKIEKELEALERATESLLTCAPTEQLANFRAVDLVSAHFAGPGVKHTEDEELSLFPRMRRHSDHAVTEIMAAMAELETQHQVAVVLEKALGTLGAQVPRNGTADRADLIELAEISASLSSLYRPHIARENELVFPAAARILTPEELHQVGVEMKARRRMMLQRSAS